MAVNAAFAVVTFASAALASATWQHPDYIRDPAGAPTVEMDFSPPKGLVDMNETLNDGVHTGIKSIAALSATGVTLQSTHIQDSSTVYVFARCTIGPAQTRGGGY